MHTLTLKIDDNIYDKFSWLLKQFKSSEVQIVDEEPFTADDTYPSVSTEEAKQKVSNAVERYKNGTGSYTTLNASHEEDMNKYIESI